MKQIKELAITCLVIILVLLAFVLGYRAAPRITFPEKLKECEKIGGYLSYTLTTRLADAFTMTTTSRVVAVSCKLPTRTVFEIDLSESDE